MSKFWYFSFCSYIAIFNIVNLISCDTPAPPMNGICTDVIASIYEGARTKDLKRCNWKGFIWDCTFEALYAEWTCKAVGHTPVEQTKVTEVK